MNVIDLPLPSQDRLFDVGGEAATISSVGITGTHETEGFKLRKGDQVELRVFATVTEVGFADKYDQEGFLVSVTRKHKLRLDDLNVVDTETGEVKR